MNSDTFNTINSWLQNFNIYDLNYLTPHQTNPTIITNIILSHQSQHPKKPFYLNRNTHNAYTTLLNITLAYINQQHHTDNIC